MTDTYVVVAEVSGLGGDDEKAKLALLRANVKTLDVFVRDDGSGEVLFRWDPDEEDDGTQTWQEAKGSLEHIRSALQGAGLPPTNPLRVELREVVKGKPARGDGVHDNQPLWNE